MDGGSLDGTVELLRDSPHIRWWSEPDRGQSDAINKGIRQARGTLITWLNADDVLEPGAVDRVVAAWRTNPDAAVFYGDSAIVERRPADPLDPPPRIRTQDFDNRGPLPQVGTFVTANALNEVGGVDDQLHLAMDFDLFLRMSLAGHRVVYTGATLATFVLHANSKSGANIHGEFLREEARSLLAAGRTEPATVALGRAGALAASLPHRQWESAYWKTVGTSPLAEQAGAHLEATRVFVQSGSIARALPHSLHPSVWRCATTRRALVSSAQRFPQRAVHRWKARALKSLGVRDDAAEAPADSGGAEATAIAGLWLSAQRVLGLVAALITVPLAARSLGTEEFSVWLLIGTLGALTGVVDLGLANGLVTHVARASAVGDHTALRRLASSGWYVALPALGVALALLLVPLVGLVDLRGGIGIGDTISRTVVSAITRAVRACHLRRPSAEPRLASATRQARDEEGGVLGRSRRRRTARCFGSVLRHRRVPPVVDARERLRSAHRWHRQHRESVPPLRPGPPTEPCVREALNRTTAREERVAVLRSGHRRCGRLPGGRTRHLGTPRCGSGSRICAAVSALHHDPDVPRVLRAASLGNACRGAPTRRG